MSSQSRISRRTWWLIALLGLLLVSFPGGYAWLSHLKAKLKAETDALESVLAEQGAEPATEEGDNRSSHAANVLAAEKQKHIWNAEHATFMLETYFGRAFLAALRNRDAELLEQFFWKDAEIELLPATGGEIRQVGPVRDVRVDSDHEALSSAHVRGAVESLVESISSLKEITGTRLRILTLETQDRKTWDSQILLTCGGQTADEKQRIVESYHALQFVFSGDEEVEAGDHIISAWRDESRSSRESGQILMTEVTQATGLGEVPLLDNWKLDSGQTSQYWFHLAVADFNKDGYADIAAAPFYGIPLLLQSDQCEAFVNVAAEMGLRRWEVDSQHLIGLAAWIDFDNDGWPDLLLGDRLYRNNMGTSFEDVTTNSRLRFGHHPMGAVVADYDCDGLVDLYVLYQHDPTLPQPAGPKPWVGDVQSGVANQLWRNEGGGRFRDVTEEANAGGGARHSFAATWHFVNDDQYPDLYIANDFGQNVHLLNRGDGTFEDVSDVTGTADFATSMGTCSGDLNNDGSPEIYVANMYSKMGRRIIRHIEDDDYAPGIYEQILGSCAGNRLYTSRPGDDHFDEVSEAVGVNQVGWAYAPTMADFNSDGLLDIYATTGFMSFDRQKPDG